jgi:hypothetical protein
MKQTDHRARTLRKRLFCKSQCFAIFSRHQSDKENLRRFEKFALNPRVKLFAVLAPIEYDGRGNGICRNWMWRVFLFFCPCHRLEKAILAHSKSQRQLARRCNSCDHWNCLICIHIFELIVKNYWMVEFSVARIRARIAVRISAGSFGHAWQSFDRSGQT